MRHKKILIVAGEPSGDLYASILIKDLKKLNPDLEFFGLGGNLAKMAGVEITFDISKLALVGVIEVLKNIFTIRRAYNSLIAKIDSTKTDLAILVDYPGFNLKLAKALKKRLIPVVYYISPQVWAWGMHRIKRIKMCIRKIIVFFKFEEDLYRRYGIDVEFVGHPLLDIVKITMSKEEFCKKYNLSPEKITIALLPGSRSIEVETLLPILVLSCNIIAKRLNNIQFVIAKHPDLPRDLYEKEIKKETLQSDIRLTDGDVYNLLGYSEFAIVASGTATLEGAIIGIPFIIVYRASFLTFLLYKFITKIRFLGLVNIIAKKEIVPELIQSDATPEKIAKKAMEILSDEKRKITMMEELKGVKSSLGSPDASPRAASAVLPLLQ